MLSPYDRPGTFKRPFQPPRAAACGRPASRRCAAGHHRPWIGWPPRPDSARWRLRRRSSLAPRSSSATGPGRARQHTLASISMPNTRFRRCAGATCAAHRTTGRTRAASRAERQQRVVATLAAAQSQEAVREDAAFEEGVELVLDEPRWPLQIPPPVAGSNSPRPGHWGVSLSRLSP